MGAAGNKCLPGPDLTADCLKGGTLIVFLLSFFPLAAVCFTAAGTHKSTKDTPDQQNTLIVCSQALRERTNHLKEHDANEENAFSYHVDV